MEQIKNQESEQLSDVLNEALQTKAEVLGINADMEGENIQMPRMFTPRGNKRNKVRQVITLKDGSEKVVWHDKRFNGPLYADYSKVWKEANTTAKINSKRQMKLRGELV